MGAGRLIVATAPSFVLVDRLARCIGHPRPAVSVRGRSAAGSAGMPCALIQSRTSDSSNSTCRPILKRASAKWLGGGSLRQLAVAAAASGLMWANMLRPFQLGKARTSHEGPWSWIRESRVASSQDSCPACHFTNASASAVM